MKRIVTFLVASILFSSVAFASFPNRFFEIKLNIPADVTNNLFSLNDILQKEVNIDFGKIADNMPSQGFNTILSINPSFGFGLNILGVHAGVTTGIEFYSKVGVSKDFFDLLGNGNVTFTENDFSIKEMNFGTNIEADLFLHADIDTSFKIGDFKIAVTPSVFMPFIHIVTEDAETILKNEDDGSLSINMNTKSKMYSFTGDLTNVSNLLNIPFNSMGFDLGCSLAFPIREDLVLEGYVHTPIVPGHLKYVSEVGYKWEAKTSLKDIAQGGGSFGQPEQIKSDFEPTDYQINRPFKFAARANYTPFGKFLIFNGNLGFGIRNPFSNGEERFFMEYLLGVTITAKDIVHATVSTEYTDEIFKHSFATGFNVRVLELDIGASLAAPTFLQSFKGNGLSGFITLCFGF